MPQKHRITCRIQLFALSLPCPNGDIEKIKYYGQKSHPK